MFQVLVQLECFKYICDLKKAKFGEILQQKNHELTFVEYKCKERRKILQFFANCREASECIVNVPACYTLYDITGSRKAQYDRERQKNDWWLDDS